MKNPSELVAYFLLHFFFHDNPILGVRYHRGPVGIWIKIHLNPKVEFLISNLVPYGRVTPIFYLPSSVLNERATIKPWSNIELGKFLVCSKL
jgi:hypothetical protein